MDLKDANVESMSVERRASGSGCQPYVRWADPSALSQMQGPCHTDLGGRRQLHDFIIFNFICSEDQLRVNIYTRRF